MEKLRKLIQEANNSYNTADHLAYVTYPLVNDINLIIKITENIYISLIALVEAILYYDREYKRIPPLPEDFSSRLEIFKTRCLERYSFDRDLILLIKDIKIILEHRKKSPIEFIRKDKLIICNSDYKIRTITIENIKSYLSRSKIFIEKLNKIFQNDRRFRGW